MLDWYAGVLHEGDAHWALLDVMLLVPNIGTGVAYSGGSVKVIKFWVYYTHTLHME